MTSGAGDDRDAAARIAAGLSGRIAGHLLTGFTGAELPDLLAAHGQIPDLDDKLVQGSPWLQAAAAFRAGRPEEAAEVYGRIGDRADEALARLRAGERLAADGQAAEANEQLTRARAFYEEVRATGYLTRIDELLA